MNVYMKIYIERLRGVCFYFLLLTRRCGNESQKQEKEKEAESFRVCAFLFSG